MPKLSLALSKNEQLTFQRVGKQEQEKANILKWEGKNKFQGHKLNVPIDVVVKTQSLAFANSWKRESFEVDWER